ncbi:MAG: right-handed parallel beta-helix repeat-containing protein [Bacilli bacterium]
MAFSERDENCSHWINTVAQKGAYYRLQHYYYGMGGVQTVSNKHLTLENMNIYSCKGHGLMVSGSQEYFQFINVKIAPPESSPKRVITCTADHLHFSRSKGHFKMIGCEFAYGSDDCINIHDLSAFGVKVDENVIELKAGSMPEVGDVVELRHGDYSPAKFKSEVVSITVTPTRKDTSTLKDKIPNPRFDGFVIFNSVRFLPCNTRLLFPQQPARGLLILASDITIENCKFVHNQMGALKFESGYTFNLWSEGFGVNNVLVKNCTFDTVNPQGVAYQGKVRDVFFGVYMRRDPSFEQTKYPVIRNVMFENNKFKNSFGTIALISSSDNIIFKDNTFENTTPRKKELPYRGAFYINHSTNTKIVNNTYIKSDLVKYPGIFVDEDTSKGIIFEGNTIVEK